MRLLFQSSADEASRLAKVETFDFLSSAFDDATVTRTFGEIRTSRPWTLIDFASHQVTPGWWRLDCETDAPPERIEVRLRSSADPLIVIKAEESSTARIYLRGETQYNISLLVSPWPEAVVFRKLALVRLSSIETTRLFIGGIARLLSQDKPFTRINRVLRRIVAGQSFGIRNGGYVDAPCALAPLRVHAQEPPKAERILLERGGIFAIVNQEDVLHEQAFDLAASAMARNPNIVAIYGDASRDGVLMQNTGWDPLLAIAGAYDNAPVFMRSISLGDRLPTLRDLAEAHANDAFLHIPLPLAKGKAIARRAVRKPDLGVSTGIRVSAIIPTKTQMDLLTTCLDGLLKTAGGSLTEIVLVDNGVTDPRFQEIIDRVSKNLKVVTVVDSGTFNFSRLINAGVAASSGDAVLLLNDDIEPTEIGWLDRMVQSVIMPDVGVVGARLLYPSGQIQHAGVMMGLGGPCGHLWKGMSAEEAETNAHVSLPGQRMAVTGACMLARREVFDQVHGLDEKFAVAFNDIDFCLRVRQANYKNIYRGDAALLHHESQSRGSDDLSAARRKRLAAETSLFLARWESLTLSDPFGSLAFDPAIERGVPHRSLFSASHTMHGGGLDS